MRAQSRALVAELEDRPPRLPHAEVAEAIAFLKWMDDDHFTYLGYREYRFQGTGASARSKIDPKSGLGLLRDPDFRIFKGLRELGKLPADVRQFVRSPVLLRITKANRRSNIHRPVQMDTVAVKLFDRAGKVVGERLSSSGSSLLSPMRAVPRRFRSCAKRSPTSCAGRASAREAMTARP